MKYKRDDIIKDLKQTVCEVTFTKVDGTHRTMRCTLDQRYIPQSINLKYLDEQHAHPKNKDIVVAWDVTINQWRSFHIDSVEYVQEVAT